MKRYIPIAASLMAFSLVSCGEVMDLTQPEKAEVTYSGITLSLNQTGKYDLYPVSYTHLTLPTICSV